MCRNAANAVMPLFPPSLVPTIRSRLGTRGSNWGGEAEAIGQAALEPVCIGLHEALEAGLSCPVPKASRFCRNLLAVYPAVVDAAVAEAARAGLSSRGLDRSPHRPARADAGSHRGLNGYHFSILTVTRFPGHADGWRAARLPARREARPSDLAIWPSTEDRYWTNCPWRKDASTLICPPGKDQCAN